MLTGVVMADNVIDELTSANFTSTNNQYSDFTDVKVTSNAVYAGQSAAGNSAIQLRSKNNNSGIVTTASGGKLISVKFVFNSITGDSRVIQLYAKKSAYTDATDLYSENKAGTLIKEIAYADGAEQTVTFENEYSFLGIRSKDGAIYLDKIEVTWDGEATVNPGDDEEKTDPVDEVQTITVAEFNAAEVSTSVWYQLTGTVNNLKDGDQYGNFDLEDETGSVYVYGLLSEKGGVKKKFQDLVAAQGIQNGSKLTLIGHRAYYEAKQQIQVADAYFVSVDNSGVKPAELTTAASVNDFLALTAGTEATLTLTNAQVTYVNVNNNKTDIFIREGNAAIDLFDLGIEAKVGYILNGTINVKLGANSGFVATVKGTNELNSTVQVTDSAAVQPLEFTDFTEAADYYCHLLIATNVTVNDKGNILDGDGVELTIYDRFKNGLQDKLKKHKDDGKAFNVTGLMYNGGESYGPELVIVAATFADGSEITDKPIELIGNGTKENPYLISDLLQLNTTILNQYADSVWVKGVVVGSINSNKQNAIVDSIPSNLALAVEAGITEFAKVVPVELKANSIFRTNLNVKDNPTNIGKEIMLFGLIQSYFNTVGFKGVKDYILDGVQYSLNVTEMKVQNRYNGAIYNLRGQRITTPGKGLYIKDGKKYFVK